MTLPELHFVSSSSFSFPSDSYALVLLATSVDGKAQLRDPNGKYSEVTQQLAGLQATGKVDELTKIWSSSHQAPVYVIGTGTDLAVNALRDRAGSASRRISHVTALVFDFAPESAEQMGAIAEGAGHGVYRYDRYRKLSDDFVPVTDIIIIGDHVDNDEHKSF